MAVRKFVIVAGFIYVVIYGQPKESIGDEKGKLQRTIGTLRIQLSKFAQKDNSSERAQLM